MGGLFGRRRSSSNSGQSGGGSRPPEYADDGVRPMPSMNNQRLLEAAREKRLAIVARSGRTSTNLSSSNGTKPYTNNFLGGTL